MSDPILMLVEWVKSPISLAILIISIIILVFRRALGQGPRFAITVAVIVVVGIGGLTAAAVLMMHVSSELQMALVVTFAISVLLLLLFVMAAGLNAYNLSDRTQPMGLPEGSIRALIALFLILIFVLMSIRIFQSVAYGTTGKLEGVPFDRLADYKDKTTSQVLNKDGKTYDLTINNPVTQAGEQLGLQIATVLGTLVTAVSAFYFGTQSLRSAVDAVQNKSGGTSGLSVDSVEPASVKVADIAKATSLTVTGSGLAQVTRVSLIQIQGGAPVVQVSNPKIVSASQINCVVDLAGLVVGTVDVEVTLSNGLSVRRDNLFEITA